MKTLCEKKKPSSQASILLDRFHCSFFGEGRCLFSSVRTFLLLTVSEDILNLHGPLIIAGHAANL